MRTDKRGMAAGSNNAWSNYQRIRHPRPHTPVLVTDRSRTRGSPNIRQSAYHTSLDTHPCKTPTESMTERGCHPQAQMFSQTFSRRKKTEIWQGSTGTAAQGKQGLQNVPGSPAGTEPCRNQAALSQQAPHPMKLPDNGGYLLCAFSRGSSTSSAFVQVLMVMLGQ